MKSNQRRTVGIEPNILRQVRSRSPCLRPGQIMFNRSSLPAIVSEPEIDVAGPPHGDSRELTARKLLRS